MSQSRLCRENCRVDCELPTNGTGRFWRACILYSLLSHLSLPPCLSVIVSLCSSFARVRSYVRVVANLCLMFPHIPLPNIFLICFFLCCSRHSLCMSFISARVPGCLLLCASQDSVPYNFSFFSIVHTSFFGIVHISFIRPAKATDSSTSSNCLLHFGTELARLQKTKTTIDIPTYFRRFVSYTCLAALSLHRGS